MKTLDPRSLDYFRNPAFVIDALFSLLVLFGSLFVNFFAGTYAALRAGNPVTDLILSNTRAYDLDGVFIYGATFFVLFVIFLCLSRPQRIPFVVKSITLFVLIRAAFITLTHIGPFPGRIAIDPGSIMNDFTFGGDLFFSGHTGLPFLMALLFWNDKRLRIFFIAMSVTFGAVVLLAHLHYSIDVASAFFITYSIYRLAQIFFRKDELMFRLGLQGAAAAKEGR